MQTPFTTGTVGLYPAPYATGVHLDALFGHKFTYMLIRKWMAQIPTHAQNNHLAPELAPFERIVRLDRHALHPTRIQFPNFATEPVFAMGALLFATGLRK